MSLFSMKFAAEGAAVFVPNGYLQLGFAAYPHDDNGDCGADCLRRMGHAAASDELTIYGIVVRYTDYWMQDTVPPEQGNVVPILPKSWRRPDVQDDLSRKGLSFLISQDNFDLLPIVFEATFNAWNKADLDRRTARRDGTAPPDLSAHSTIIANPGPTQQESSLKSGAPRGGRPPKYDWDEFWIEVNLWVHLNGLEDVHRSELQTHMVAWAANRWDNPPEDGTIRNKLGSLYKAARSRGI